MSQRALLASFLCALTIPLLAATSLHPVDPICIQCYDGQLVFADVDGDGLTDVLLPKTSEVKFNLNGRFSSPIAAPGISANDAYKAPGDYNGDGYADLIARRIGGAHDEGPDRLLFGDGTGRFREGTPFPTQYGDGTGAPTAVDYDGDHNLDLIVMKGAYVPELDETIVTLSFLRGTGDGAFTFDQTLDVAGGAYPEMAFADFNEDGRNDLLLAIRGRPYVYSYLADANGRWMAPKVRYSAGRAFTITPADINGDGHADVVMTANMPDGSHSVIGLYGNGSGYFPEFAQFMDADYRGRLTVGDFYQGGGDEIAFVSEGREELLVLAAAGDQLQIVAQTPFALPNAYIHSGMFRRGGGSGFFVIASQQLGRPQNSGGFFFTDGVLAPAVLAGDSRRRASRSANTTVAGPERYQNALNGPCPVAGLKNWTLTREGFFAELQVEGAKSAEAAILGQSLITRIVVADGAKDRVLQGQLSLVYDRLRGVLNDAADTSCGPKAWVSVEGQRQAN
ncbi:MAG TPA: VCBS repeat-containing protein [Thermoanaerobaculia bacterium]